MTIRSLFLLVVFVFTALLGGLVFVSFLAAQNQSAWALSEEQRFESFKLADELRQSSDDLTRFARTYVVTGDEKYERFFHDVLAIRNGQMPRPNNYDAIYWDLVIASGDRATSGMLPAASLDDLMEEMNFTADEFAKLKEAENRSDNLVKLEEKAIHAVKGLFADDDGRYTVKGEPDLKMAREIMHGAAYHDAKAQIMEPINDFLIMLDARTALEVAQLRQKGRVYAWVTLGLNGVALVFAISMFVLMHRRVIIPVRKLVTAAEQVEKGEYGKPIDHESSDELGELAAAFGHMTQSIESDLTKREQAEEQLRQSEERFDLAIRGCGDGLWDYNPLSNEVWYAPRFKEMLGFEDHEFENVLSSWEDLLHPDDHDRVMAELNAHIVDQKPYDVEYRLRAKSGEYLWFRARGDSLRDEKGVAYRAAGSITDINARKQAEQELRKLSRAIESSSSSVIITDLNGDIEYVNPKFTDVTGYTAAEVLGKNPRMLQSGDQPVAFYVDLWKTITDGQEWHGEFCNVKKNGERYWELASISPIRNEGKEITHFVAIKDDVTSQKEAQDELRKAREQADKANEAKSAFLANMSHEIRTPMNGILGMTELALDTDLNPEQREFLQTVHSSGEVLLALLNDILDFSKIEAGRLEIDPVPFELRNAISDTLDTLAARAHGKGLELTYEIPAEVPDAFIGDVHRLRQVVINLVGNAIKFTDKGEIGVTITKAEQSGDDITLHIAVRDTGIGIQADRLDAVLRPFEQADVSTTRKYGGTGLGLAISIQLAQLMGGRLWVDSVPGEGSVFQFTVVMKLGDESAKPKAISADSLDGLAVLVVDDNATNRRILQEMLTHWRMNPQLVGSAADALKAMAFARENSAPFGLVLSDVNMPEMDGFELLETLKASQHDADVPVVFLTSASRSGDFARAREMGVAAHLRKPVRQSLLLDTIFNVVGQSAVDGESPSQASRPPPPTQDPRQSHDAPASDRALRILLAEDNQVNQKFATRIITKAGHEVFVANNGREAVEACHRETFDIVLMDVQMPEMDGLEATAAIRNSNHASRTIPIVAMTANAMKGDKEMCLKAGMDGYVSKPVKQQTLFAEIQRVLDRPNPTT